MPKLKWLAKDIPSKCVALNGERTAWTFEGVDRLMLECLANGQRVWRVRYQVWSGGRRQERKYEIGRFDPEAKRAVANIEQDHVLSPGQARNKATAILARVDGGEDPWLADRTARLKPAPTARTVEGVYRDWLDHPGRKRQLRPRTRGEYEDVFRLHISPHFGKTDITALEKPDIVRALEAVRKATSDPEKGQRGLQATKTLKLLKSICGYAVDKDYASRDPTRGIDDPVPMKNPTGKRHRPPTNDELRLIWTRAPDHLQSQVVRVLYLALLLGKRVSELVGGQKRELQLDAREPYWLIPGTREGNKSREDQVVPLPHLAVRILRGAIEESGDSPYIFQARRRIASTPMSRHTPSQEFAAFRSTIKVGANVRLHDCRGLIVDQMAQLRIPSEFRSQVLHHTGDMRATLADASYSTYDYFDEKRRCLRLWALRLLEIIRNRRPRGLHW